ncbi:hypothetical protein [Neptuniibacter sp. QD37_11]|uniref:hypothetical protein n=1 Tax=Neptuniibacter sp. QD37_11 TaxID=3398209 RepID=UPI0039F49FAB
MYAFIFLMVWIFVLPQFAAEWLSSAVLFVYEPFRDLMVWAIGEPSVEGWDWNYIWHSLPWYDSADIMRGFESDSFLMIHVVVGIFLSGIVVSLGSSASHNEFLDIVRRSNS